MEKKKKVVVAYSGGLDTSYTVMYLAHELGYEVHARFQQRATQSQRRKRLQAGGGKICYPRRYAGILREKP